MHPLLQENALIDLCQRKNIQITAYSSLGSLSYSNNPMYKSMPSLLETPEIVEMSRKYNVSPAQILLSWAVNTRGVAVIPKTSNVNRLKENLDVLELHLEEEDVHTIAQFDCGVRFNDKTTAWGVSLFS